jgi:subtilisin family serine protease
LFDLNDNSINDVRDKPEIVCPDGGNTTFFGFDIGDPGDGSDADSFPNFFGTSAAAPHAAAVAALMLEANSALASGAVYSILQQTAADMGPAGFDDDTGFGFCQADLAVEMAITGFDTSGEKVYLPVIFKNFN